MVEQKELVTLFKIKKLDEEYEALIPFAVVEGIYNEENYTFMTKDGIVYPHIEEAIYPNIGYANRTITEIDTSFEKEEFGSIDFEMERKFNMDNAKKYLRLSSEPNKIYIKIYRNMLFFYYLTFIFKNIHILCFLYILHKICQVFLFINISF